MTDVAVVVFRHFSIIEHAHDHYPQRVEKDSRLALETNVIEDDMRAKATSLLPTLDQGAGEVEASVPTEHEKDSGDPQGAGKRERGGGNSSHYRRHDIKIVLRDNINYASRRKYLAIDFVARFNVCQVDHRTAVGVHGLFFFIESW